MGLFEKIPEHPQRLHSQVEIDLNDFRRSLGAKFNAVVAAVEKLELESTKKNVDQIFLVSEKIEALKNCLSLLNQIDFNEKYPPIHVHLEDLDFENTLKAGEENKRDFFDDDEYL